MGCRRGLYAASTWIHLDAAAPGDWRRRRLPQLRSLGITRSVQECVRAAGVSPPPCSIPGQCRCVSLPIRKGGRTWYLCEVGKQGSLAISREGIGNPGQRNQKPLAVTED